MAKHPSNDVAMTFRLPAELHASFMAACASADRPASQVIRDAVRAFVAANPQPEFVFSPAQKRHKPVKGGG